MDSAIATVPPLSLNVLVQLSGIDVADVLVFRHRPYEPSLNRVFDWIAAEREDLFECYQSCHNPKTEAALSRAKYLAAFIRHTPGTALFIGFYKVDGFQPMSVEYCMNRPLHRELMGLGMTGTTASENRASLLEFNMPRTDWHGEWKGRLIIRWPGLERSWYRWLDRNEFIVDAIAQQSLLSRVMPPWDEITLRWNELAALPSAWRTALREWRGIYLIIDVQDGRQYVGSAYGVENLLQRWLAYARSGHGGNKHLKGRDPANFRFSILQRVSPDMPDAEVVKIENTWKDRLRTCAPHGLNDN